MFYYKTLTRLWHDFHTASTRLKDDLICRKVPESLTQQLDFEKTIRQLQQSGKSFKMGKKSRHSQTGLSQDYYCTVTCIFTFTEVDIKGVCADTACTWGGPDDDVEVNG